MDKRNQHKPFSLNEAKEVWNSISANGDDKYVQVNEHERIEFQLKLLARIEAYKSKKRKRKIALFSTISAAAIIVIASLIIYQYSLSKPDIYFAKERMDITLKDGSKVALLKGAKLTIEKSFPSDTRDVYLEGDAIFNVTKSKEHPFIVHAGNYETTVLGTIFKVVQRGSSINVDLYEGKVQISNLARPKEFYILKPQETFSNMGSLKVATVFSTQKNQIDIKNKTATFTLSGVALAEAIKILESRYGIAVKYPVDRMASPISLNKENATAEDLIGLISVQLNLNSKKINEKTFELED